nr:ATP-binding protein [Brevibacterium aurantiacum]
MSFDERLRLVVDEAHSVFNHAKIEGLIRRAGLRYPAADLRQLDRVDERGLDRNVIAQLGTCSFIERGQNVVFQGFTGSGKSYLGCALAKRACQHRIRAHYIRMPDLEEAWAQALDLSSTTERRFVESRSIRAGHRFGRSVCGTLTVCLRWVHVASLAESYYRIRSHGRPDCAQGPRQSHRPRTPGLCSHTGRTDRVAHRWRRQTRVLRGGRATRTRAGTAR